MFKLFRRAWAYLTASLTGKFNEAADPKVQLEQAILEAQDQHRRLKEQAANVIANQKQTELRLNRAMGELEKEIDDLKTLHLQSTQAAEQAKAAVQQNANALQQRLAERQKLLSQLDQAKMQEQMNRAMSSLSETVGQDVPTLEEVRDKIEARYAKARGMSELQGESVEGRMLEVEQASMNTEAQARLSEIRSSLGIGTGSATETPSVGQATPEAAPQEQAPPA